MEGVLFALTVSGELRAGLLAEFVEERGGVFCATVHGAFLPAFAGRRLSTTTVMLAVCTTDVARLVVLTTTIANLLVFVRARDIVLSVKEPAGWSR